LFPPAKIVVDDQPNPSNPPIKPVWTELPVVFDTIQEFNRGLLRGRSKENFTATREVESGTSKRRDRKGAICEVHFLFKTVLPCCSVPE
jgi:hypothetical protein